MKKPVLADRLREARQSFIDPTLKRALTQAELASRVGVAMTSISEIERGRMPRTDLLLRLAEALQTTAAWLLGEGPSTYTVSDNAPSRVLREEPPTIVLKRAADQTRANVLKLSEISGYAKAVLQMLESLTEQQRHVVTGLAPYSDREDVVGSLLELSEDALRGKVNAIAERDSATPSAGTAAAKKRRPGSGGK